MNWVDKQLFREVLASHQGANWQTNKTQISDITFVGCRALTEMVGEDRIDST